MITGVESFKEHLIASDGVIDPVFVHHEFSSGMHGRKIDFDAIPDDSELFNEWVDVTARLIHFLYAATHTGKLALLSVANGTNRLVGPVAAMLEKNTTSLHTKKISSRKVILTPRAKEIIRIQQPHNLVAVEDVGTTGQFALSAVLAAREEEDVGHADAVFSWQRQRPLKAMEDNGIYYQSLICDETSYPTLPAEECRSSGPCAQGWKLIEYPRQTE